MGIPAGLFQTLADQFMDDTFAAFKKSLIMRTADAVVFGTDQTYTLEPLASEPEKTAIPLSLDFSLFDSELISVGDFLLFTNASQWATDPEGDSVDLIFNGVTLQIILVEKDADDAAFFLTVRRK